MYSQSTFRDFESVTGSYYEVPGSWSYEDFRVKDSKPAGNGNYIRLPLKRFGPDGIVGDWVNNNSAGRASASPDYVNMYRNLRYGFNADGDYQNMRGETPRYSGGSRVPGIMQNINRQNTDLTHDKSPRTNHQIIPEHGTSTCQCNACQYGNYVYANIGTGLQNKNRVNSYITVGGNPAPGQQNSKHLGNSVFEQHDSFRRIGQNLDAGNPYQNWQQYYPAANSQISHQHLYSRNTFQDNKQLRQQTELLAVDTDDYTSADDYMLINRASIPVINFETVSAQLSKNSKQKRDPPWKWFYPPTPPIPRQTMFVKIPEPPSEPPPLPPIHEDALSMSEDTRGKRVRFSGRDDIIFRTPSVRSIETNSVMDASELVMYC